MFVPNLFDASFKHCVLEKLFEGVVACLLGGAVLWWVVGQSGPEKSTVLVHVTEPDVEVSVGGQTFLIEDREYAPIECQLRAGRHSLCMKRGDRVLYSEWFTVRRGEDVILTAYYHR
jgi:hypothetical protein